MDFASSPFVRLIAGLGNPGLQYERTRHNIGFMIVERLARRRDVELKAESRWQAEVACVQGLWFFRPASFMNRSGGPLRAFADYHRITPEQTLVIYDDAALPLGRLRLRRGGSAGGHNGMQSVIDHFGTPAVPRLRVGIGAAGESAALVGHVLGRFSREEEPVLERVLERAADAADCVCENGIDAAMNLYNQSDKEL